MKTFHTLVIGAGSGGLTVAAGLANLGKEVALIEARRVGGDCTNVGCIPSKTLIHLAQAGDMSPVAILSEVRRKRDHLHEKETDWVKHAAKLSFIPGRAVFVAANQLEVMSSGGHETLSAPNIVIATGSSPRTLTLDGLPSARALSNETLFELTAPPEHLVILGAGIIGVEMAFAFHRMGSRVTVLETAGRILERLEPEVSQVINESLSERGVQVLLQASAKRYEEASHTLWLEQRGVERTLAGVDKVLFAIGRTSNTEGLGLERLGLTFDRRGIATDDRNATNIPGVYAVGDVTQTSAFTHSANAQGRRLVRHLAFPWLPTRKVSPYPAAIFSEPEVASIGPTLETLEQRYPRQLIATMRADLQDTDKGYTDGLKRGFVLIHALRLSGRVLSATLVAPHASEMLPLLALAVSRRLSLYHLSSLVFAYPTLAEGVKKAADGFVFDTLPHLPHELAAYLRYRFTAPQNQASSREKRENEHRPLPK
jgi:pyruvate/2-oxoglutarate dehydrogenase complex dihydrolipoamide dehydrogenase (E3) component